MENSKNNKADIDFELEPWKATIKLLGALAENHYKDYVPSLIFINHLSDRYKEQILAKCHDPNDGYYTTDKEEISYILTDPDECFSKGVYILPLEATLGISSGEC